MQTRDRSAETFHQFWSVDRGIFDTARELAHAHAHTSVTEGAEHASTLTAAHTRDRQQLPRYSSTRPATSTQSHRNDPVARPGPPSQPPIPLTQEVRPPCHRRNAAAPAGLR